VRFYVSKTDYMNNATAKYVKWMQFCHFSFFAIFYLTLFKETQNPRQFFVLKKWNFVKKSSKTGIEIKNPNNY